MPPQSDPIGEFIALPRDQQLSVLSQMTRGKQDQLLLAVKVRRAQKPYSGPEAPQGSAWERFKSAAIAPIKGAAESILNANPTPEEQKEGLTSSYDFWMRPFERVVEAQEGQVGEAKDLAKQGRYSEAAGHALASAVPLVGPWVADAAQQFYGQVGRGDVAGAVGTAAGNTALALTPVIHEKVVGPVTRGLRDKVSAARENFGSAPRAMRGLVKDVRNENAAAIEKYQDDLEKAKTKHSGELLRLKQEYDQSVRDANEKARQGTEQDRQKVSEKNLAAKQKYDAAVRAANDKFEADRSAAEEANRKAQSEYNKKVGKAVQKNREVSGAERAKSDQAAKTQVQGSQLIDRIRRLNDKVRSQANAMYDAVREKVGNAEVPRQSLQDEVSSAEKKWIRGSPEKVKEFRAMTETREQSPNLTLANQTAENLGYGDFQEAISNPSMRETLSRVLPPDVFKEASGEAVKPLSWNDLQGFYEETGRKLASGNLPGDVYQAIKQVHQAIGDMMQRVADKKGVGADFAKARKFYRDYMETFNEPTGPSGSGSPVAQVLLAKDPEKAVGFFAGDSGDRGVAMLRRYDPDLANLAQNARENANSSVRVPQRGRVSAASIPKPEPKAAPAGANLPLPPVVENPPAPRSPNLELPPVLPPTPEESVPIPSSRKIGVSDIRAAKGEHLEEMGHKLHGRVMWAVLTPTLIAIEQLVRLHGLSLGEIGAAAGGTVGMAEVSRLVSSLFENPSFVEFMTRATPKDVAAIPPELRGDIPEIIKVAKARGITVSPALSAAFGSVSGPKTRQLQKTADEYRRTASQ